jgi:hypothetical protein
MKRHITLTIAAVALTLTAVLAGCTNGGGSNGIYGGASSAAPAAPASAAPAAPASAAPAAPAASVAPASGGYGY